MEALSSVAAGLEAIGWSIFKSGFSLSLAGPASGSNRYCRTPGSFQTNSPTAEVVQPKAAAVVDPSPAINVMH
jgi:hypothetical protein